jgi:Na+/glutamate symporter
MKGMQLRSTAAALTIGAFVGVLTGVPSAAWTLAQMPAGPASTGEHDRMMADCHRMMDRGEHMAGQNLAITFEGRLTPTTRYSKD